MSTAIASISILGFACCVTASADSYTFTTLNDRGGGGQPTGINDSGQIVGNNVFGGFLYANGAFTYFDGIGLYAGGINDSGMVSGTLSIGARDMGAIVNGSTITTFSVPGSVRTLGYQINDSGVVDGYYTTSGPGSPFIYTYNGSNFTTFIPPGAMYAFPDGFNNAGQIAGEYATAANTLVQFFYDGTSFHQIACPNSNSTVVMGLSNSGTVFGSCGVLGSSGKDFFYKDGVYSYVDAPGLITGMNDAGVIVGYYPAATGDNVGFIGTPIPAQVPEPSEFLLLFPGALFLLLRPEVSRRHQHSNSRPSEAKNAEHRMSPVVRRKSRSTSASA